MMFNSDALAYAGRYPTLNLEGAGLRPSIGLVVSAVVVSFVAGVALLGDQREVAVGVVALWVVAVVAISPRAGIVLALGIQILDTLMNPEEEGGYSWLSPGRILPFLVILSYMRVRLGRRPNVQAIRRSLLYFFMFVAWGMFSVIFAELRGVALWTILKLFVHVAVLMAAVDLLSEPRALRQTLLIMVVGGGVGALLALLGVGTTSTDASARLALVGVGVNSLAISLGTGVTAAAALILMRRTPIVVILATCATITMLVTSFRTGTRSVLIGVPLAVTIGAAVGYRHKIHKFLAVGTVVAALAGGSFFWAIQSDFIRGELQDRLLGVFESGTYESNVRWELWSQGLTVYAANPLGTGAGNEALLYWRLGGSSDDALESHNTFLSVLIQYNIVGLFLFGAGICSIGAAILRMRDPAMQTAAATILLFCIISAMKGTLQDTRLFWQPILLVCVIVETEYRVRQHAASSFRASSFRPAAYGQRLN